jgi:hypothetical protein
VAKRREDNEAELETLRNVKGFLTKKLKSNEKVIGTLQNDIKTLKDYI